MINWNDCSPLTKDEWLDFVALGIPQFKNRESKNSWDILINGFTMDMICHELFCLSYAINPPEEWQRPFQKVKEMNEIWDYITEIIDWSDEDKEYAADHNLCIADLVINKVNEITNQLF